MEKEPEINTYRGEIGSEYWIPSVFVPDSSVHGLPAWLQRQGGGHLYASGRTALDAIVRDIQGERETALVYMPAYCCDSMVEPFRRNGWRILFYEVGMEKGRLVGKADTSVKCDVFFSLSYFGFCDEGLPEVQSVFKAGGAVVIEDRTHSLFCGKETEADYSFASLRKWFGLPDGGIAWKCEGTFGEGGTTVSSFGRLRWETMREKGRYMEDDPSVDKASFLQKLRESEELLDRDYAGYGMSEVSRQLLGREDIGQLQERRRENARFLYEELSGTEGIEWVYACLRPEDCPLFVPLIVKHGLRDELRKYLTDRKIYCPVHWSRPEYVPDGSCGLYRNGLSLVCDQRYTPAHMKRVAEGIKKFYHERYCCHSGGRSALG